MLVKQNLRLFTAATSVLSIDRPSSPGFGWGVAEAPPPATQCPRGAKGHLGIAVRGVVVVDRTSPGVIVTFGSGSRCWGASAAFDFLSPGLHSQALERYSHEKVFPFLDRNCRSRDRFGGRRRPSRRQPHPRGFRIERPGPIAARQSGEALRRALPSPVPFQPHEELDERSQRPGVLPRASTIFSSSTTPRGKNWGNMTWGHAVSPDMFHWTQLAHAIHPDKLGTIFSGSAVVDENNTAGFQSGKEKVLVASTPRPAELLPSPKGNLSRSRSPIATTAAEPGPSMPAIPCSSTSPAQNRDPKVFWHAPSRQWIMALYLDGNTYALLASPNLKQWSKLCDVPVPGGSECPDFFTLPVDGDATKTKWVFWSANNSYLLGHVRRQDVSARGRTAADALWKAPLCGPDLQQHPPARRPHGFKSPG